MAPLITTHEPPSIYAVYLSMWTHMKLKVWELTRLFDSKLI